MVSPSWLLAWVACAAWASCGAGATEGRGEVCGAGCRCAGAALSCRGAGLSAPPALVPTVTHLDVSDNEIFALLPDAFGDAPALRDLNLSGNPLGGAATDASAWSLGAVSGGALLRLRAARCGLHAVPQDIAHRHLQYLDFSENEVDELHPLPALPSLHTLDLRKNKLVHIDERAFRDAPNIRILRLDENMLSHLPGAISDLRHLEELSASRNAITRVSAGILSPCERLVRVSLAHNPLSELDPSAFDHLPRLVSLVLSDASGLVAAPHLEGAHRLASLRVDRARLAALPPALCEHAPQLRTLDVKLNLLQHFPDLSKCSELRVLDLSSNAIPLLEEESLRGVGRLRDLQLARNALRRIGRNVFRHTPHLRYLDLEENELEFIDGEAFLPITQLEELNVGGNRLRSLPAGGLQALRALRAHNNPTLTRFHPPDLFPRIQTLVLSYAYHCCEFLSLMEQQAELDEGEGEEEEDNGKLTDFVLVPSQHLDVAAWANATDLYQHYLNLSGGGVAGDVAGGGAGWRGGAAWRGAGGAGGGGGGGGGGGAAGAGARRVSCVPLPGPFLPCSDLFEWWALRCGVWAVFLLALLGNGTVVVVLGSMRSRLDVPRFLVANLAAADFCMGLYLAVLAVVDAGTLGEFRERAVSWQLSGACSAAGFLAVLSSELSVYTLAVITLERNYAITHAMHLNKRLSLRHAAAVMAAGWTFAIVAAALPLLGVSDYRKFAVCLPFETSTPVALGYVTTVLAVNGLAFLVLLGCYLKMYCAIRGSQAWNSNDSRIAKRMALLVFTDFLCWSPIAFFALTAAFGFELVSLEEAKVFTVFVLPLNSCCNPFLYAILTKQFKKDCALVCKAIEESRVTRGIGRCRHSSNFSNRQTPANTSSLAERSSRAHAASCACRRLLVEERAAPHGERLLRWLRACSAAPPPPPAPAPPPRAGSVSSSVEFSSSRSDSWRRPPPPPRRAASWLVARKTSQDSNLSSSRNDSSGSNATASTGTWRTSRSAGAVSVVTAGGVVGAVGAVRPRLTRQPHVTPEDPSEPRLLTTIPSAAEADPPPPPPPPPPEPGPGSKTASL